MADWHKTREEANQDGSCARISACLNNHDDRQHPHTQLLYCNRCANMIEGANEEYHLRLKWVGMDLDKLMEDITDTDGVLDDLAGFVRTICRNRRFVQSDDKVGELAAELSDILHTSAVKALELWIDDFIRPIRE